MDKISVIYVTTANQESARSIAKTLLEEKLIACANILPEAQSLYRWEGEIKSETESLMILKTATSLVTKVTERVRALHSYECPCIVSWRLESGHEAFLQWVGTQVLADKTGT